MWEALAGAPHYAATGEFELMSHVAAGKARKLSEGGVRAAPELEAAMAKALARSAEERYAKASDLARDLAAHLHRTWPDYASAELGAIVEELFKPRFEALAARLRLFEDGQERPSGTLAPALGNAALEATDVHRAAQETPAVTTEPLGPKASTTAPYSPPAPSEPLEAKAELKVKGKVSKPSKPPRAPKRQRKQDEAIERALKQDRRLEGNKKPGAPPSRALVLGLAALAFVVAVGAGIGGMSWLRGDDPSPAPPPQLDPRLAPLPPRPGEPKLPPRPDDPKPKKPVDHRPTTAPPPADGPKGALDLECEPAVCEIEIDGRKAGPAPLHEIALTAGTHRVRAINRQVNAAKIFSTEIAEGKTTRARINLILGP